MNRFLSLMLLCAAACAAPKAQSRASDNGGVEVKKAPPEAVKLAAANGQPDPNQLICTFEEDTGSHIPQKTCRTRWQIDEERRQATDWMTNLSRSNGGKVGP
jgi:hypothetical protein